jgi:hypothetical protein
MVGEVPLRILRSRWQNNVEMVLVKWRIFWTITHTKIVEGRYRETVILFILGP